MSDNLFFDIEDEVCSSETSINFYQCCIPEGNTTCSSSNFHIHLFSSTSLHLKLYKILQNNVTSEISVSFIDRVAVKRNYALCAGQTLWEKRPTLMLSPLSRKNVTKNVFSNSLAYRSSFPK
jgi:hypothetical protein